MDFLKRAGFAVFEAGLMPDVVLRVGVRQLCQQRLDECRLCGDVEAQQAKLMNWIEHLKNSEIALLTEAANEQHYELVRIFSTREWPYWFLSRRRRARCVGGVHSFPMCFIVRFLAQLSAKIRLKRVL